jgi:hypothetical protein
MTTMGTRLIAMLTIHPDAWYSEQSLRVHGIDGEALADARKSGDLPWRELGRGIRLYLGSELLAWFEKRKQAPQRRLQG